MGLHRFRFSSFDVDFHAHELRRNGVRVRLTGQPLRILEILLASAGEVVTRETLRRELWSADTFVDFEHNLNSAVKRLRAAIGDSAETPRFIETLPRVGYRFIAPVMMVPESPPTETPIANPPAIPTAADTAAAAVVTPANPPLHAYTGTRPLVVSTAAVCLVAFATAVWFVGQWREAGPVAQGGFRSVAVLPFRNLSVGPSPDQLADSVTEALINALGRLDAVRVVSRTSVMPYQDTRLTIPEIGATLRVDAVVEGSVMRVGRDRVRITAQLVDVFTDRHLWAASVDGVAADFLALQEQIARAISLKMGGIAPADAGSRVAASQPEDQAVRELYLKGRHLLNQRTEAGLRRALDYFEQARKRAPGYALAHAGVAAVWEEFARLPSALPPKDALPRAKAAAMSALAIDDTLVEALTSLAFVHEVFDRDFAAAERTYQRAIALDPGYALAPQRYAIHLVRTGRQAAAVDMARLARDIDPLSINANVALAQAMVSAGRAHEGLERMLDAVELDPGYYDTYVHLSEVYVSLGRFDDAIDAAARGVELSGRAAHALQALALVYAAQGRSDEALPLIEELERHPTQRSTWDLAMTHLAVHQTDRALFWLRQACIDRPPLLAFLKTAQVAPTFDAVRTDPRFQEILDCAEPSV